MARIAGKRFGRVSVAAALALLAAAGGLFGRVWAGETVRFSDTKKSPPVPERAKKDRSSSFGGLLDRDSSLGGVTAVPFSSVYTPSSKPAGKGITARERDFLDQRNNWMQLTPDDIALTEKSASEAFGVRDYSLENLQDQRQRRKGDLQRYVEKLDDKNRKDQDKAEADSSEKSASFLIGGDLTKLERSESDRTAAEAGQGRGEMVAGLTDLLALTRLDDKWFGRNRDSLTDSLVKGGMVDMFKDGFRAQGLDRFRPSRSTFMQKSPAGELNADPLGRPGLGALDPVNYQPDLTRQQLNPILGQTISQPSQATTVSLPDYMRPLPLPALFSRPGVVDGLNLGAITTPGMSPTPTLPLQPQKDRFSPAKFEIPNRPY